MRIQGLGEVQTTGFGLQASGCWASVLDTQLKKSLKRGIPNRLRVCPGWPVLRSAFAPSTSLARRHRRSSVEIRLPRSGVRLRATAGVSGTPGLSDSWFAGRSNPESALSDFDDGHRPLTPFRNR